MKRGKTTKNDVTEETECGQGVAQVAGGSSGIWNLESGIAERTEYGREKIQREHAYSRSGTVRTVGEDM